jgi:hypothetical protein
MSGAPIPPTVPIVSWQRLNAVSRFAVLLLPEQNRLTNSTEVLLGFPLQVLINALTGHMDLKGRICPVKRPIKSDDPDADYGLACCSRNALTVALAPTVTVRVFCQGVNPLFSNLTWWSPGARRRVDGVFPMYLSSTVMSAPSGVDLMSICRQCRRACGYYWGGSSAGGERRIHCKFRCVEWNIAARVSSYIGALRDRSVFAFHEKKQRWSWKENDGRRNHRTRHRADVLLRRRL